METSKQETQELTLQRADRESFVVSHQNNVN